MSIILLCFAMVLLISLTISLRSRLFGVGFDGALWKKYDPLRKVKTSTLATSLGLVLELVSAILCHHMIQGLNNFTPWGP